jgi:dienelactone hydrolase
VKEELHWWSEALLERGLATIVFDGPGLGQTFHRMSMVAEPRPVGTAIMNHIETRPELDPNAVAFVGMSLGGYLVIRMATHERRIRAVAAVSPPYSADIYWNVTLSSLRRELATLYGITEAEMGASVDKITLADVLQDMRCPLMLAGGGHDLITPGSEAWRIFNGARCERELVFYPRGAHDCFNVLGDLRPRLARWIARQLAPHHAASRRTKPATSVEPGWGAAEAVDDEFGDALAGDVPRLAWNQAIGGALPARWRWWWKSPHSDHIEVVERSAPADLGVDGVGYPRAVGLQKPALPKAGVPKASHPKPA